MWSSHRLTFGLGLLAATATAYSPFADVEEFRPRPLLEFCDSSVSEGMRLCEGTTHRTLEDGGVVGLKWAMHVDPDRVLSLDMERQHGVQLLKCTPSTLEIELPESHAKHARVGDLIMGSHFVHGCKHLMQVKDEDNKDDFPTNENLYHRVVKVTSMDWRHDEKRGRVARTKLWTRELPSLGHAVGTLTYDFSFTPPEAVDENPFPYRRTWDGQEFHKGKWVHEELRRLHTGGYGQNFEGPSVAGSDMSEDDFHPINDGSEGNDQTPDGRRPLYAGSFVRPGDTPKGINAGANSDIRYEVDGGHPVLGGTMVSTDDVKSLLNLAPKKVANFGWNWDFKINGSQDISFNYTVPGSKMSLMIRKPYIKAHSSLNIRFRSYMPHENAEDTFFNDNTWVSLKKKTSDKHASIFEQWEPRVKWECSLPGHGALEVGILAQMNAKTDASSNPLDLIQIPVLQDFWKPKWFGTLDFALGSFPVSMTPGIQFKAKFFHYGTFRGSLAVGLRSFPTYNPKVQYDSFTGLRVNLFAKMRETTITPPNWLAHTSHFEAGIALEPTIWIKAHFGQTRGSTKFAAALRPYFNMTITRKGDEMLHGDYQNELVVYPFRVIGMRASSPNSRYKVRITTSMPKVQCRDTNNAYGGAHDLSHYSEGNQIPHAAYSANGNELPNCAQYDRRVDSSESISYGDIEWNDPVDRYSLGWIAQRMLQYLNIRVQLIEVDYSTGKPFERASESVNIRCKTQVNGVCQPSPSVRSVWFKNNKVQISLHMVWKRNARDWFARRVRGVATSVPEVIINKDYIQQVDPGFSIDSYVDNGVVSGQNVDKPLVLALRHAFKSYPIILNKHNGYVPGINSSSMKSDEIIELGANFLSTWDRSCLSGTHGCDPSVALYYGETELAAANIPKIPWNGNNRAPETLDSAFGGAADTSRIIPVSVALKPAYHNPNPAPGAASAEPQTNAWQHVGLVRLQFAVSNPANWNRWIRPYEFTPVGLGSSYKLVWTLNHVDPTVAKAFTINILKAGPSGGDGAGGYTGAQGERKYLRQRVGTRWFEQISSEAVTIQPMELDGTTRTRFDHMIAFNAMGDGDIIMVQLQWMDKHEHQHTMNSPPFLVNTEAQPKSSNPVNKAEGSEEAPTPDGALPAAKRRLVSHRRLNFFSNWFGDSSDHGWKRQANGQWTHKYQENHEQEEDRRQCARKDLLFKFGAGVMFRGWVSHLSFPKDLPMLGAIQNSPDMGLPWTSITDWMSEPQDLASKLPSLLCRQGVCSASLPGCSEYNTMQHYYPEVTVQFKHTVRYPRGKEKLDPKNAWVGELRQALSFVFATMPNMITVLAHYTVNEQPAGIVDDPNHRHRRRYMQYHSAQSGVAACEGHGYDMAKCGSVGCCQYDEPTGECHSAVGPGPCFVKDAPGFLSSATLGEPLTPAATPAEPLTPAATPAVPEVAKPLAAVTAAPEATAPTAPAAGPVIAPLGQRRLEAEDLEEEDDEEDNEGISHVTLKFTGGLQYHVDNLLLEAMQNEGLFRQVEELSTEGKPVRIHSFKVRQLKADNLTEKKESLVDGISEALRDSPVRMLLVGAIAVGTLLGVAVAIRRVHRGNYAPVSEDTLLPVE